MNVLPGVTQPNPLHPASKVGVVRERVRNIFEQSRDRTGARQGLEVREVRSRYHQLYGQPCRRIGAHIDAIFSDGNIARMNKGVYIWVDGVPQPKKVNRLIDTENLPKRRKPIPNEPHTMTSVQVRGALAIRYDIDLSVKLIGMLAKEGVIPHSQPTGPRGDYRYPPRVVPLLNKIWYVGK